MNQPKIKEETTMKKLLILALALMMSLSFACAEEETPAFTPTDSNVLVACFSRTAAPIRK